MSCRFRLLPVWQNHDLIPGVSDDGILLLLYRADNIFQRSAASFRPAPALRIIVINLHITFKLVNHPAIANLVLPLGRNFSVYRSGSGAW